MDDLVMWADQYKEELQKQSTNRAHLIESLLFAGDYQAIREWLEEWESEDAASNSLAQQYKRTLSSLKAQRQLQLRGFCHDQH